MADEAVEKGRLTRIRRANQRDVTAPRRLIPGSGHRSGDVLLGPVDDFSVGAEPDARARFGVADDFIEDPDARAIADNVRMHRQLENPALFVSRVELAAENIEDIAWGRIGAERLKPVHHEINRVVAHPFDWKLDDTGRLAIEQKLVAILVAH